MEDKGLFEKYVDMIRKRAHYYAKAYHVDYDELESQGFLIYCKALNDFDIEKSSFSTHLYIELKRLKDFCITYKRQQGQLIWDSAEELNLIFDERNENIIAEDLLEDTRSSYSLELFLENAKKELSDIAYVVIEWIVQRSWEKKGRKTPTFILASKLLNIPIETAENAWNECCSYWNEKGCLLYC